MSTSARPICTSILQSLVIERQQYLQNTESYSLKYARRLVSGLSKNIRKRYAENAVLAWEHAEQQLPWALVLPRVRGPRGRGAPCPIGIPAFSPGVARGLT